MHTAVTPLLSMMISNSCKAWPSPRHLYITDVPLKWMSSTAHDRLNEHVDSPDHQQHARHASHVRDLRGQFLDEDERGDRRDPHQIHHTDDEQQRHQRPATADAEDAVARAHPECAANAFPPVL